MSLEFPRYIRKWSTENRKMISNWCPDEIFTSPPPDRSRCFVLSLHVVRSISEFILNLSRRRPNKNILSEHCILHCNLVNTKKIWNCIDKVINASDTMCALCVLQLSNYLHTLIISSLSPAWGKALAPAIVSGYSGILIWVWAEDQMIFWLSFIHILPV